LKHGHEEYEGHEEKTGSSSSVAFVLLLHEFSSGVAYLQKNIRQHAPHRGNWWGDAMRNDTDDVI